MYDIMIIGGGPAGVSAALYTARAGLSTAIVYRDTGALASAPVVDNFYGRGETSGPGLVAEGIDHAKRVGVEILNEEVVSVSLEKNFIVKTLDSTYETCMLVMATGASRKSPKIKGIDIYEGKGVSHCAVCDAFFFRSKDVAVLGSGAYALSEAMVLKPLVKSVTIFTNNKELATDFPNDFTIKTEAISELRGENTLKEIVLESGEIISIDGLFIAIGVAGGSELALKLGATVESNNIVTDRNQRTSIPGLWAAGDCTPGMRQIAKAVYEGALAGSDAVKYLQIHKANGCDRFCAASLKAWEV